MRRGAALLAASLSLSGCLATQHDMLQVQEQSDQIKSHVSDLKKTLASLQANQADLSTKMDQVRGDLSAFTENLKDNTTGAMEKGDSAAKSVATVVEPVVAAPVVDRPVASSGPVDGARASDV